MIVGDVWQVGNNWAYNAADVALALVLISMAVMLLAAVAMMITVSFNVPTWVDNMFVSGPLLVGAPLFALSAATLLVMVFVGAGVNSEALLEGIQNQGFENVEWVGFYDPNDEVRDFVGSIDGLYVEGRVVELKDGYQILTEKGENSGS